MLAAQRGKQRLQELRPVEKPLDIGEEGPCHDHRIGGGSGADRAIHADDLTGRGLHRLAVERFDAPREQRRGAAAMAVFVGPDLGNVHGLNEYLGVESLLQGRDFLYRLVKIYADGK